MNLSFTLCPESIAALPAKGRSAFVRAAILAFSKPAQTSKVLPVAASVEPPPAIVEPVAWVRTWSKPPCDMPADVDFSKLVHKLEGGRSTCLNPPPWPAVPGLNMNHCLDWQDYVKKWRFPDPFPGPLEWHAMGEPETPSPEHRAIVDLPVAESPVAGVSQESPPAVAECPVDPLPVVGVSSNILEDV